MKKNLTSIVFLFLCHQSFSQKKATEEVRTLIDKYVQSINNADTALASKLFSHSREVSFIQPRGHQRGWDEIRSQIYAFFSDQFSKGISK